MQGDIERILIDRAAISSRVKALAGQIASDFGLSGSVEGGDPSAESITIVPILTGSLVFVADLMRELPAYVRLRMLAARSYPGKSTTSQGVQIEDMLTGDESDALSGDSVLLVDDILDSGRTITAARRLLAERGAKVVRTVVLLSKPMSRRLVESVEVDYVGFEIPDEFVVGYGLDYNDYYRNLPDLVTLRAEALAR